MLGLVGYNHYKHKPKNYCNGNGVIDSADALAFAELPGRAAKSQHLAKAAL